MPSQIYFTEAARSDLHGLDQEIASRIVKKLAWFGGQQNPLCFAVRLTTSFLGTYRFRVGDYRILFDVSKDKTIIILIILRIKHRKEVYMSP